MEVSPRDIYLSQLQFATAARPPASVRSDAAASVVGGLGVV
jgi:hypothetical protein